MGWPRKSEGMRIYADKKEKGAYFAIFPEERDFRGQWDALANVHGGPEPSLVGTTIGQDYLTRTWPKRVEWTELPPEWQEAFKAYMEQGGDGPFDPKEYRGLWRIGKRPVRDGQSLAPR